MGKSGRWEKGLKLTGTGSPALVEYLPCGRPSVGHFIDFVTREEQSEVDCRMMGREEIRRIQVMLKYV